MTNKRFWWNCKHIEVDNNLGVAFCTKNNDFCNKSKCTEIQGNPKKQYYRERMEELKKENEQLKLDKQQLHRAMSREEVRHKQFKNKVFDLINEKIKEYQKYDGYDTEKYYIGTQLLNKLKKELLE